MRIPMITAHSGCEGTERDSMLSLERAVSLGADAAEVDVRRGGGGVLRISHDRKTDAQYAYSPALEGVFERLKGTSLRLNCDIKEPEVIDDVLYMAAREGFGPDRLILSGSVSPERMAGEPGIAERAAVYLNIEEILKLFYCGELAASGRGDKFRELSSEPWRFVAHMLPRGFDPGAAADVCRSVGAHGLNFPVKGLDGELAEKLRQTGIPLSVWTVNSADGAELCFAAGAENITTLAVAKLMDARKEKYGS